LLGYTALVLGFSHSSFASSLVQVQTSCSPAENDFTSISVSCSQGTFSAAASATLTSLGAKASLTDDNGTGGAVAFAQDVMHVGGVPNGTPIDLTFEFTYAGTYSWLFDPGDRPVDEFLRVEPQVSFSFGSNTLVNTGGLLSKVICGSNSQPVFSGCDIYADSGNEVEAGTLISPTALTTAGSSISTNLSLGSVFEMGVTTITSVDVDFLDPLTISDIIATDPTTGQVLSGVTITGDSGTIYAVNATPEPSTFAFFVGGIGGLLWITTRTTKPSNT
jgi:hypothetical protein